MNVKVGFRQLLNEAEQEIDSLDAASAIKLVGNSDVVFVDLREPDERYRHGYIDGSVHAVRGELEFYVDPASPFHMPVFQQDRHFVLHCAGGWRSALAALTLQQMGFPRVSHVSGGFSAWVKAGGPVRRFNAEEAKPKVDSIGGVFIRARDIGALSAWYARHFGFALNEANSITFRWRQDHDPGSQGITVWSLFDRNSDYLGAPDRQVMVNFRVHDLDAFLMELEAAGVAQARPRMAHEYGKFAWVSDCEENLIELWEPVEGM